MSPSVQTNLDAALKVTNGIMPIQVNVPTSELGEAVAYLKGKRNAKAIRLAEKGA
jgi:hypothetical protein